MKRFPIIRYRFLFWWGLGQGVAIVMNRKEQPLAWSALYVPAIFLVVGTVAYAFTFYGEWKWANRDV